ncbi:hypothetical protein ACH4U3_44450 [Streptomyces griseoruber]|uniref:hypothetical protein n=1 Tax=Streptomyces griseoruber TaxID=1943 RepID=UPI00378EAC7A
MPGGTHLNLSEQRRDHPVAPAGQRLPDACGERPADGGALAAVQLRCLGEGAVREPDHEVGGAAGEPAIATISVSTVSTCHW